MSCSRQTTEQYAERIEYCRDKLREISDSMVLGDGTHETWACGIAASHLLPDLLDKVNRFGDPVTYRCVDDDSNTYQCSGCGLLWSFESDGPFENDLDYCPKCGKPVQHGVPL